MPTYTLNTIIVYNNWQRKALNPTLLETNMETQPKRLQSFYVSLGESWGVGPGFSFGVFGLRPWTGQGFKLKGLSCLEPHPPQVAQDSH